MESGSRRDSGRLQDARGEAKRVNVDGNVKVDSASRGSLPHVHTTLKSTFTYTHLYWHSRDPLSSEIVLIRQLGPRSLHDVDAE